MGKKEIMKTKTKGLLKKVALTITTATILFGGVVSPMTVEAKGTAFINKKVSSVTPTIKSAKRANGKITVTVTVPKAKVKKLGSVKKITVAYGSTKNSKKFEALKTKVKVTKKSATKYTFTFTNKKLSSYKNAYMTVRFDGKSNWSKLVKVSGKATTTTSTSNYWLECNTCHKRWEGNDLKELEAKHTAHAEEMSAAYWSQQTVINTITVDGYTYNVYSNEAIANYVGHTGFTYGGGMITSK